MRAQETMSGAEVAVSEGRDGAVHVLADSIGEAITQVGFVLTLATAAYLASRLLSGFGKATP